MVHRLLGNPIHPEEPTGSIRKLYSTLRKMNAKKPIILVLYGVALYFVLRQYYKNQSGLPNPKVIRNPTYLYGILALASDFTGGLTIPLAAGMTVALIWQANGTGKPATTTAKKPVTPSTQNMTPSDRTATG